MSDYVHPETLVDADWVAQHTDDSDIRLIEVDEDSSAYETGHIPNAVGWSWFTDLHDRLRRDYVDREGLSRCSGRRAWARTPPSFFTAGTTTGSPLTPTGSAATSASTQ